MSSTEEGTNLARLPAGYRYENKYEGNTIPHTVLKTTSKVIIPNNNLQVKYIMG
jgi:hypothetical protein